MFAGGFRYVVDHRILSAFVVEFCAKRLCNGRRSTELAASHGGRYEHDLELFALDIGHVV
jgi:hypothetical protein